MTTEEQVPGAGWYDDGTGQTRWWDGAAWTQHVAPEPVVAPAPAVPAADVADATPAEPLRPGAPDPRRALAPEDRAPDLPAAQQTFVPESFLAEQTFAPELAHAGASSAGGSSYLHTTPEPAAGVGSRFGGATMPGRAGFAGPEHAPVIISSGRGKGWLIALLVLVVVGVIGLTVFRIFGPDNKPAATPSVVAAALESAAPKGELPRGFTAVGDIGGFKLTKACTDGGSCQALQLAAKATCKRLSALVLFAGPSGNRLGSDVVSAQNVKMGKAVTVRAVIAADGATTVRVSSVVCQPF